MVEMDKREATENLEKRALERDAAEKARVDLEARLAEVRDACDVAKEKFDDAIIHYVMAVVKEA